MLRGDRGGLGAVARTRRDRTRRDGARRDAGPSSAPSPRSSPSHDSISRSGAGGSDSDRPKRCVAAAAWPTAFFTAFLAAANRVVGASAPGPWPPGTCAPGSDIRAVPADDGGGWGAGGGWRSPGPTARGRPGRDLPDGSVDDRMRRRHRQAGHHPPRGACVRLAGGFHPDRACSASVSSTAVPTNSRRPGVS